MRDGRIVLLSLVVTLACGESARQATTAGSAARGSGAAAGTHGGVGSGGATTGAGGTTGNGGTAGASRGAGGSSAGSGRGGQPGAGREGAAGGGSGTSSRAGAGGAEAGSDGVGGNGIGGDGVGGTSAGGEAGAGAAPVPSCVLHVNGATGDDGRDGKSWSGALRTVTRALALADYGCELWITRGTYVPGTARTDTFSLLHGETLRGGFDGGEATPDERRDSGEWTTLSGEIGNVNTTTDNAFHVVTTIGSLLERIQVTGGNADDQGGCGGGIVSSGGLTLVDCELRGNSAARSGGAVSTLGTVDIEQTFFYDNAAGTYGGALAAGDGTLTVVGSSFDANTASDGAAMLTSGTSVIGGSSFTNNNVRAGGGVVTSVAQIQIDDSTFTGNAGSALSTRCATADCSAIVNASIFSGNRAPEGAAIVASGSNVSVDQSTFDGNGATGRGGAISARQATLDLSRTTFSAHTADTDGGAIALENGATLRTASLGFYDNVADRGGAVYADETSSVDLNQCVFEDNAATHEGGAVYLAGATFSLVRDSLLTANSATDGAALYQAVEAGAGSPTTVKNSTIAFNVGTGTNVFDAPGSLLIQNSIFWQDQPGELELHDGDAVTLVTSNLSGAPPNITAFDPHFALPPTDLRLAADSPCIDTGDDTTAILWDLENQIRVDVPNMPACRHGVVCNSRADMGCYEYVP